MKERHNCSHCKTELDLKLFFLSKNEIITGMICHLSIRKTLAHAILGLCLLVQNKMTEIATYIGDCRGEKEERKKYVRIYLNLLEEKQKMLLFNLNLRLIYFNAIYRGREK